MICWLMKLSGTLVPAKNSRASFFCMISKHPLSSFGFSWTPQQAHLNLEFQPVCQQTCVSQLLEIGEKEIFFVVKRSSKTILWGNYPKTFFNTSWVFPLFPLSCLYKHHRPTGWLTLKYTRNSLLQIKGVL